MQLVLDIGNTRSKLGLFEGERLVEQVRWTAWTPAQLAEWLAGRPVERAILSSVAAPDPDLRTTLQGYFDVLELNATTPLPFRNAYRTPETLGKDRVAAVAGAGALFPGQHCLTVDCGTCIKYDLLTAEGIYRGGNIAPGARMRIQAMHHFTARLPEVPLDMPVDFIGDSTTTALQNGALRGAALEINGFARLFAQSATPLQVILSGGDAALLQPYVEFPGLVLVPELTLLGLRHILEFNLKQVEKG